MELFHCAVDDKTPGYIMGIIYIYNDDDGASVQQKIRVNIHFSIGKKIPNVLYYLNIDDVIKTRSAIF